MVMTRPQSTRVCAALQIRSSIPATESHVKLYLDRAFPEIALQEVITIASPRQFDHAVQVAQSFIARRSQRTRIVFLIVDLVLLDADINAVSGRGRERRRETLTWTPSRHAFQEIFSYLESTDM
jgi:hypothetical protein